MQFDQFALECRLADIPREVAQQARLLLLDLVGVAASAVPTRLSRIARDHAAEHFGPGRHASPILFDGRRASPPGAALAGGMTIDAVDAHDGHKLTKGHAGCGMFPSVLAMAQATGLEDDAEFLARIVIGYEIGTRAGISLHATAPDYHTSGAWVAVACAALGARALGLDRPQLRHAIGIAEYHGPRSQMMRVIDHPVMLKDGSGWGAMAGTSAALLAQSGFTGAPAVTVEADDVNGFWSDLGSRWRIMEQYVKPHPVCRWAQPPVVAATELVARHAVGHADIGHIEVETFHEAVRLATREPATTEEAQYSLPFPVAAAVVRGRLTPAEIDGEALTDPDMLRLSRSLVLREDADCNAAFPARRFARVTLVLRDGARLVSPLTEAAGDPEAPFPESFIRSKFRDYAAPALGEDRASRIEAAIDALGRGGALKALTDELGAV